MKKFSELLVQYPACDGEIYDYQNYFRSRDKLGILTVVAADLLSLDFTYTSWRIWC